MKEEKPKAPGDNDQSVQARDDAYWEQRQAEYEQREARKEARRQHDVDLRREQEEKERLAAASRSDDEPGWFDRVRAGVGEAEDVIENKVGGFFTDLFSGWFVEHTPGRVLPGGPAVPHGAGVLQQQSVVAGEAAGKIAVYGAESAGGAGAAKLLELGGGALLGSLGRVGKSVHPSIPGKPFTGVNAAADAFAQLARHHGVAPSVAGNRLHRLKEAGGLGPADDVAIGRTGDVYNASTGEFLGSLTDKSLGQ